MASDPLILHATCVDVLGCAVLILGPSGSGKSSLGLQLIGMGAELVADDRTIVQEDQGRLIACAPETIAGQIEARGVGILEIPYVEQADVVLAVDLSRDERERLPEEYLITVLDITLPCLHKFDAPHFASAIHAYLRGSRIDPS